MSKGFHLPDETRFTSAETGEAHEAHRALKDLRYIVAAVNADAQKAWADLWQELKDGVTPAGVVLPNMQQGFKPSCGWAEFLEKFWLLKHYLDSTRRLCQGSSEH